jgi:hypothetical protein
MLDIRNPRDLKESLGISDPWRLLSKDVVPSTWVRLMGRPVHRRTGRGTHQIKPLSVALLGLRFRVKKV